jgi:eukaryotic-like serine/threonine-protein kinase
LLSSNGTRRPCAAGETRGRLGGIDPERAARVTAAYFLRLKPGNILVNRDGEPRLLDFGVAHLLAREGVGITATGGANLLTPAYASPEQVRGEPVSTATDVYALGLILFELLSGEVAQDMSTTSRPSEWETLVCEADAPPLRQLLLPRWIRGSSRAMLADLEAVVGKTLRKRAAERYATVADLMADLQAVRDLQPVRARTPSTFYILKRALRRHRAAAAAAVLLLSLLAAGVVREVQLRHQAEAAVEQANAQSKRATAVLGFVQKAFAAAGPRRQGAQLKVTDMLLTAAADSDAVADQDIDTYLALTQTIGAALLVAGMYPDAERYAEAALQRTASVAELERMPLVDILADAVAFQQRYPESVAHFQRAFDVRLQALGELDPETVTALARLADIHVAVGDVDTAISLGERSVRNAEAIHGRPSLGLATALHNYALVHFSRTRLVPAFGALDDAYRMLRQMPASEARDQQLVSTLVMRTQTVVMAQPDERAARLLDEAEAELRELVGEKASVLYSIEHQRALLAMIHGDTSAAATAALRSLDMVKSAFGPTSHRRITAGTNAGNALCEDDRCEEGMQILSETLELARAGMAPDSYRTLRVEGHIQLARAVLDGFVDRAAFADVIERSEPLGGTVAWDMRALLGEALLRIGETAEGAELLRQSYDQASSRLGWEFPAVREMARKAGEAYGLLGDTALAEDLQARAVATLELPQAR